MSEERGRNRESRPGNDNFWLICLLSGIALLALLFFVLAAILRVRRAREVRLAPDSEIIPTLTATITPTPTPSITPSLTPTSIFPSPAPTSVCPRDGSAADGHGSFQPSRPSVQVTPPICGATPQS